MQLFFSSNALNKEYIIYVDSIYKKLIFHFFSQYGLEGFDFLSCQLNYWVFYLTSNYHLLIYRYFASA